MKKVVLIGGGHGLSALVSGFKNEEVDVSIIVSSTDDGGHTGKLRNEFKCVAVGDLRMVLNEFINDNSILKEVFNYRFSSLHENKNISLGNLIIVSLIEKYKDIDKVIECFRVKENIRPHLYMSSNTPHTLCAECNDGKIVEFERNIGETNCNIKRLFVDGNPVCNEEMLGKIIDADIIVLSPGSLYTSVGAVLCIDKIKSAIKLSAATIIYVCNVMTQDGETKGFTVENHVEALENIMEKKINRVIVNNGAIPDDVLEKYKEENSYVVVFDNKRTDYETYDLIEIKEGKIRHNSDIVKKIILNQ